MVASEIRKKLSKYYATPWGWTLAIWKTFTFFIYVIIQNIRCILKSRQKNMYVCIHEIIRLIIKMKMKNRSHRYDINRFRSRHGLKYSKYKKCLSIMIRYQENSPLENSHPSTSPPENSHLSNSPSPWRIPPRKTPTHQITPLENFPRKILGRTFPGGIFQGGVWCVGIFRVGIFPGGIFLEPDDAPKQHLKLNSWKS